MALSNSLPFCEPSFIEDKSRNWKTFLKKMYREDIPDNFKQIITEINPFLELLADALRGSTNVNVYWHAGNGWLDSPK